MHSSMMLIQQCCSYQRRACAMSLFRCPTAHSVLSLCCWSSVKDAVQAPNPRQNQKASFMPGCVLLLNHVAIAVLQLQKQGLRRGFLHSIRSTKSVVFVLLVCSTRQRASLEQSRSVKGHSRHFPSQCDQPHLPSQYRLP